MKYFTSLLALAASVSSMATEPVVSYDGFKVLRVPFENKQATSTFNKISSPLGIKILEGGTSDGFADIAIPHKMLGLFESKMAGLTSLENVIHEDLGKDIREESVYEPYVAGSLNDTWFNAFHPYKEHITWFKDLQAKYSSHSAIVSSGRSGEGNDLFGLHIHGSTKGTKPAAIFHSNVHAREWITSKTLEFIAQSLLANYGKDNDVTAMLDKYDVYIIPVVNPDGFIFSQTNDRMWRKNRSKNGNSNCRGTDNNRNWNHKWGGPGASSDPCNETYRGSGAGSEPENKALTAFMGEVQRKQGLKLYIDWHSYGNYILTPYGYTSNKAPRHDEHMKLGQGAAQALKAVHGQNFKVGPTSTTLYAVSGGSNDYALDVSKVDYALVYELRGGTFVVKPDQIRPSGEECYAATKYMLKNM